MIETGGPFSATGAIATGPLIVLYENICSTLIGMCANDICCLPSIDRARGSQNRPSYNPYSTATAEISTFIGDVNDFATILRSGFILMLSLFDWSSIRVQMSIGVARRYAART